MLPSIVIFEKLKPLAEDTKNVLEKVKVLTSTSL